MANITVPEDKKAEIEKLEVIAKLGGYNIEIVHRAKVKYRHLWVKSELPWCIKWYKYSRTYAPNRINFKTFDGLERGVMRLIGRNS